MRPNVLFTFHAAVRTCEKNYAHTQPFPRYFFRSAYFVKMKQRGANKMLPEWLVMSPEDRSVGYKYAQQVKCAAGLLKCTNNRSILKANAHSASSF